MLKYYLVVTCAVLFLQFCFAQDEQCIRCPRGPSGKKGPPGLGLTGPPGVVNYTQIEEIMKRKIDITLSKFVARLDRIESNMMPDHTTTSHSKPATTCKDLFYNGKCFKVIQGRGSVTFTDGETICRDIGWNLANIYDVKHYKEMEEYIRSKPVGGAFWTGLTYSVQNRQIFLKSGQEVDLTGIRWFPAYPVDSPLFTKIAILVQKKSNISSQGIHNYPPLYGRTGAICEQ